MKKLLILLTVTTALMAAEDDTLTASALSIHQASAPVIMEDFTLPAPVSMLSPRGCFSEADIREDMKTVLTPLWTKEKYIQSFIRAGVTGKRKIHTDTGVFIIELRNLK